MAGEIGEPVSLEFKVTVRFGSFFFFFNALNELMRIG